MYSLVPSSDITIIGLGMRLVHKRNYELTTHMAGTVSSRSKEGVPLCALDQEGMLSARKPLNTDWP